MSIFLGDTPLANNAVSRNIGEIIQSTIPLTDAGLHLLDGSLINGAGSYSAFVTYIAGLVSSYPDLFETEANWQSSVSTYGVCGKFVYDSTNNTVRLPKITGFTEGTTDLTALGDLVQAGLPNITGFCAGMFAGVSTTGTEGALYKEGNSYAGLSTNTDNNNSRLGFDASRSSSIYGKSTTVQPQAIKVLYYIVIANSVKTNIEVDIDEIMTDLNGKADVDLSNSSVPHIVETYVNGTSWYRVWSDGWCEQGGMHSAGQNVTVTLLKPYRDTNYIVLLTGIASSQAYTPLVRSGNTATNFHVFSAGNGSHSGFWQACGYIN